MSTTTASATSMNFVGFEEMRGQGTPDLLHNRIFIAPSLPQTAGKWIHGWIHTWAATVSEAAKDDME